MHRWAGLLLSGSNEVKSSTYLYRTSNSKAYNYVTDIVSPNDKLLLELFLRFLLTLKYTNNTMQSMYFYF